MSTLFRKLAVGSIVAAPALAGCTSGEILEADGGPLTGYNGPSTITFYNTSTGQSYSVATYMTGGEMVFSFDPYVDAGPTNGTYIPAGHYKLDLDLCTDATHCQHYGNWTGFDVAYNQTCTDTHTSQSVPCAAFKVVRCQWPSDYQQYGASLCQNATVSGGITTVGVLDGP